MAVQVENGAQQQKVIESLQIGLVNSPVNHIKMDFSISTLYHTKINFANFL
ncbi:MAG: hypothetical protein ACI9L9_002644 [Marivirga sp.]|jgi:hypothetical protein